MMMKLVVEVAVREDAVIGMILSSRWRLNETKLLILLIDLLNTHVHKLQKYSYLEPVLLRMRYLCC